MRCHQFFGFFAIPVLQPILVFSCSSCVPGAGHLANWLLHDLNFRDVSLASASSQQVMALEDTTVFFGGPILTMAGGQYSLVSALVVKGDTIIFAGELNEARKITGLATRQVFLNGRSLMPGFIEPHLHLIFTALADNYLLKLSPPQTTSPGITTLDQAKSTMQGALGSVPDGKWLVGYGYDPSRIDVNLPSPRRHPDLNRTYLDGISNKIPIFILNQSGHIAYVNSPTFAVANITDDNVKNDTSFQKDANGHLTGLLFEQAIARVVRCTPKPSPLEVAEYCNSTLNYWLSQGCTTVFDAGIGTGGAEEPDLISSLSMPLRFHGAISNYIARPNATFIKTPPYMLGQANISAIKFWADGSTQGFTAFLNSDYLPGLPSWANPLGNPNYNTSILLQEAMEPWLRREFQIMVHANGDGATLQTLAAYDAIFKANPDRNPNIRHRIEHFTVTDEEQLQTARNLGLAVSNTIGHVNYWGSTFNDYVLGTDRTQRIDPVNSEETLGLIWSLNSDSPLTNVNPLLYVKTAATRELFQNGSTLGGNQFVSVETAFKGVTVNPAAQIGVADQVGSLEVGKKADMVVLSQDPRSVDPTDLDKLVVEQTWVGGVRAY
ncbi:MAG: hypothetical protein Q9214_002425 [Letrouitia sp. 1 TL-2023]